MEDNGRKGIILAGGKGTRLWPITSGVSKQLLPIYNKPSIYYPLTTLMLSGIREFLIIVNPSDLNNFRALLKDGQHLGISINYEIQSNPNGIAEAFIIGEKFIGKSDVALILGDNFFYGNSLSQILNQASKKNQGATIFASEVKDPNRYGVVDFDKDLKIKSITEKPLKPQSNYAITGIYYYDNKVVEYSKTLKPSRRGELEITDINKLYMDEGNLVVEKMSRGMTWLDTGTLESLHEASSYIRALEKRQGLKIGCPEEIAWRLGYINDNELNLLSENLLKSGYGNYLKSILKEGRKQSNIFGII